MISETPMLIDSTTNDPISFIKLYGTITDKATEQNESNPEFSLTYLKIDDGTGSMWIRGFNEALERISKWDFVLVIGSLLIEKTDGNLYDIIVNPDSISKVNNKKWEIVHNLDILVKSSKRKVKSAEKFVKKNPDNMRNQISPQEEPKDDFEVESDSTQQDSLSLKIEHILRENDVGDGVVFSEIVKQLQGFDESEIDDVLFELAYEGKVYQPKPDYYKIMD